jgi:hypothetical protein
MEGWLVDNELWGITTVAWFHVLSRMMAGGTENIHEKTRSGYPALGFEPRTIEYETGVLTILSWPSVPNTV